MSFKARRFVTIILIELCKKSTEKNSEAMCNHVNYAMCHSQIMYSCKLFPYYLCSCKVRIYQITSVNQVISVNKIEKSRKAHLAFSSQEVVTHNNDFNYQSGVRARQRRFTCSYCEFVCEMADYTFSNEINLNCVSQFF